MPDVLRFLRRSSRRDRHLDRDVRRELEHHVQASTEYLVGQGLPADAARAEAVRRLGSMEEAERRLYPYARDRERLMQLRDWTYSLAADLRHAGRALRRQPMLAVVVVLTLALGIGVNAAMYGILDRLLLSGPAHVRDADRVRRVYFTRDAGDGPPRTFDVTNYATLTGLEEHARHFAALAAYRSPWEMVLGEGEELSRVQVEYATWRLFPLLGVEPAAGRFFDASEDAPPAGQPVVVLGHGLWTRQFGADPSVIGRRVRLDGNSFTVIGVAPRGFTGPELGRVDAWLPVSAGAHPRQDWPTTWNAKWLRIVGRLKPGASADEAGAEATIVYREVYGGTAEADRDLTVTVRPLLYGPAGNEPMEATVSRWVMGVAAIVLLIACANVANILLARGVERRREIVLRVALGITRLRLIRLLVADVLVLAAAGGVSALLVARWSGRLIQSVLLPDIAWEGVAADGRLLLFTAGATLATVVLIAPLPALQALRLRLAESLKDGGQQAGSRRGRLRHGLTAAQAALSVVLLVGAGLFVQSLARVQRLDLGLDTDRVQVLWLNWKPTGDLSAGERRAERARRQTVTERAVARLAALPFVESTSAAIGLPFQAAFGVDLRVPGRDAVPDQPGGGPYISAVAAGYFETVGTELLQGRVFTNDGRGTEPVAIVNQTMARTLWPGEDPLDKCLIIGNGDRPCSRVVGVVEDTRRFQIEEEAAFQYYVPLGQEVEIGGTALLVRPAANAAGVAAMAWRELRALDPTLAYVTVRSLQETVDPQVRPWRLGAALFMGFGGLAFLIATIGLYSAIAYATAQRTQEMGIRMALGARRGDVLRLVVWNGLTVAAMGVGLGVLVALAGGPSLEPLLFHTSSRSPMVFAVVVGLLMAASLVASFVPARRATKVDPVLALRF